MQLLLLYSTDPRLNVKMRVTLLAQAFCITTCLALEFNFAGSNHAAYTCGKCDRVLHYECLPYGTCCSSCDECVAWGKANGVCAGCSKEDCTTDCHPNMTPQEKCCKDCGPCGNLLDHCCVCHRPKSCPGGKWPCKQRLIVMSIEKSLTSYSVEEVYRSYCTGD